jgi:hypothetical protein
MDLETCRKIILAEGRLYFVTQLLPSNTDPECRAAAWQALGILHEVLEEAGIRCFPRVTRDGKLEE